MNHKKIIIAVDGYSSCGKSTLAKQIAEQLSYIYVDTGAMYRAVTLYFMQHQLFKNGKLDRSNLSEHLKQINIDFKRQSTRQAETFLNGQNVERDIRSMEVSNLVSEVSKHAEIRRQMVELQQKMGIAKGLIMDGRDIGTVVFPNAEVKLFITAEPEIRAKRRYEELKSKEPKLTIEQVLENITQRDYQDVNRTESPLKKAEDAIIIDNSYLTRQEQLALALEIISKNTKP